jgi:hypothetical protein
MHAHVHVHACVLISFLFLSVKTQSSVCLFALLSLPDSCLPDSLFLLDTVIFDCTTTSCRPCQPTFLPGFHRLGEFECFSWVFTEYCA